MLQPPPQRQGNNNGQPEQVANGEFHGVVPARRPPPRGRRGWTFSSASFQLTRGCIANHPQASNGGSTSTTIIKLRRLYFMDYGLGGFAAGAEELGKSSGLGEGAGDFFSTAGMRRGFGRGKPP